MVSVNRKYLDVKSFILTSRYSATLNRYSEEVRTERVKPE